MKKKVQKKNRNDLALEDFKEKHAKKQEKSMEGQAYAKKNEQIRTENEFVTELMQGRYFLARANMMVDQLNSGKITELIDGTPKTQEVLQCEFAMTKKQAMTRFRNAHFAKEDLKSQYKLSEEDIDAILDDHYNGKIIRESYDEKYKRRGKAGFVPEN